MTTSSAPLRRGSQCCKAYTTEHISALNMVWRNSCLQSLLLKYTMGLVTPLKFWVRTAPIPPGLLVVSKVASQNMVNGRPVLGKAMRVFSNNIALIWRKASCAGAGRSPCLVVDFHFDVCCQFCQGCSQ